MSSIPQPLSVIALITPMQYPTEQIMLIGVMYLLLYSFLILLLLREQNMDRDWSVPWPVLFHSDAMSPITTE